MRRSVPVPALLAAFVLCAAPFSHARSPAPVSIVRAEQEAEAIIAQRIDGERARFAPDAPRLVANGELTRIARERSNDMAHGAPFAHEDSQGRLAASEMMRARINPFGSFGENIMMETRENLPFNASAFAKEAVEGWMASEGHRANILSPDYDRSGIGVVVNGGNAYATQVFMGPQREAPQPKRPR